MEALEFSDFRFSKLSDNEVVKRVMSGEKELYEILMRRNNQKLFRVLRGYLNEQSEIEDIMQDAYLKAYEKLHQFKRDAQFSTWLIRIGINLALARIKQKSRLSIPQEIDSIDIEIRDDHPEPESGMMRHEAKVLLESAIGQLEDKYRSVYIMREIEEMPVAEIADCLDISVANVKVRIHRAKSMIKDQLLALSFSPELFEFGFSKCDGLVERVLTKL